MRNISLLNQLEKENLFLKDEIRRKDKVINILLENFSYHVQQLNYITSKNIDGSTQTEQQIKNNTQLSTASNIHHIIIASAKENVKNRKKLNINQLNSKTSDKTLVNENYNNEEENLWIKIMKNLKMKKLQSKAIPKCCIKKGSCAIIVGDSTVKHLHGKSAVNKASKDNIMFAKPFPGAPTKATKHLSLDLEKNPDLVIRDFKMQCDNGNDVIKKKKEKRRKNSLWQLFKMYV